MTTRAQEIVAGTGGDDASSITEYQAGQHRPRVWQDGERIYVVAMRQPPRGHADRAWELAKDQTAAARYGTTLWVATGSVDEDSQPGAKRP